MDLDSIFKAYDVRGLVPEQLDEAAARDIGAAFAPAGELACLTAISRLAGAMLTYPSTSRNLRS